jgi:SAM-dependent methyltransferase
MSRERPIGGTTRQGRAGAEVSYYKRDFWGAENLKYAEPHFRMRKVARTISRLSQGKQCDLLDLGCGPAALAQLLPANIRYHGIDIAIQDPAPNLIEMDILAQPISFRGQKFDLITAQGLFEYVGEFQARKLAEIADLLRDDGKLVVTYQNFAHRKCSIYQPYSNVQLPEDFRADLSRFFKIERSFPVAHNWNHGHPNRKFVQAPQEHLSINVPIVSRFLAVDYLYICSPMPGPATPS